LWTLGDDDLVALGSGQVRSPVTVSAVLPDGQVDRVGIHWDVEVHDKLAGTAVRLIGICQGRPVGRTPYIRSSSRKGSNRTSISLAFFCRSTADRPLFSGRHHLTLLMFQKTGNGIPAIGLG
jgi:hypothetical protein